MYLLPLGSGETNECLCMVAGSFQCLTGLLSFGSEPIVERSVARDDEPVLKVGGYPSMVLCV